MYDVERALYCVHIVDEDWPTPVIHWDTHSTEEKSEWVFRGISRESNHRKGNA